MKSLKSRVYESLNGYSKALKWSLNNRIYMDDFKDIFQLFDVWDDVVKKTKKFWDILEAKDNVRIPLRNGVFYMMRVDVGDENIYSAFTIFIENLTGIKAEVVEKNGATHRYYFRADNYLQKK